MRIEIHHHCRDARSYRAARVKSLFNADSGCNFNLTAELPIDDDGWRIGLVVGPSGSGKSSIGRSIFGDDAVYSGVWPQRAPIIDAIAPKGDFNAVTSALAAVGLGSVPCWLRPYHVLSNGEKFRADLARIIADAPARVVVDEFTSPLDRQIARFGALAFGKAWRRTNGQAVLLSCHYDVIDWLEPDWIFDTSTGKFAGRGLWRRPTFELEIWETDWRYWPLFEPHYYLKLNKMVGAKCYVGVVDGELVSHVAVSTMAGMIYSRASRLVVMPEWQGAGVGLRFLNEVCSMWTGGRNRFNKSLPTIFHTSHPGLCASLRRNCRWQQISATLYGDNKRRSIQTLKKSGQGSGGGYGGHFRPVQGFRFVGDA